MDYKHAFFQVLTRYYIYLSIFSDIAFSQKSLENCIFLKNQLKEIFWQSLRENFTINIYERNAEKFNSLRKLKLKNKI